MIIILIFLFILSSLFYIIGANTLLYITNIFIVLYSVIMCEFFNDELYKDIYETDITMNLNNFCLIVIIFVFYFFTILFFIVSKNKIIKKI